jgi:hypothetical protein
MFPPFSSAFAFVLIGATLLAAGNPAAAQPLILQGVRAPAEGSAGPGSPSPPGGAPAPSTRPIAARAAAEEAIFNRDLKLNGSAGSLRIERAGRSEIRARFAFEGTRLTRPGEACTVKLEDTVAMTARGRPEGLARYDFQIPVCPITADVVEGGLFVKAAACTFEASDCRVELSGLWGPEPAALVAQARAIEQDRGQADRAVRENYKALTQRAKPQDVRAVVGEQAAFSAERETACRAYAREGAHGFCNARFTEARAAMLAARLGVGGGPQSTAPSTTGSSAAQPARRAAPVPIRPPPASLLPNPE